MAEVRRRDKVLFAKIQGPITAASAESFPSAVPTAVSRSRSAMGSYSPISPATSPAAAASTAEVGDGLAVAVEATYRLLW